MDKFKEIGIKIIYFFLDIYLIFLAGIFPKGINNVLNFKYPTITDNFFGNIFLQITVETLLIAYIIYNLSNINKSKNLYHELKDKKLKDIRLKEISNFTRYSQLSFPYIMAIANLYFLFRLIAFYSLKLLSLEFIFILAFLIIVSLYLYSMTISNKKFYYIYDNSH